MLSRIWLSSKKRERSLGQYWWGAATGIPHLGITWVTIRNGVLGLHQLFGLLDHLSSETSDALDEKNNGNI